MAVEQVQHRKHDLRARLERLVGDAKIILWECALPGPVFTYVSPQAESILGFPLDQWLEPGFWVARIHPDDREAAIEYCSERTRLGLDHEFEYRLVAADGRAVWIRDIVTVIPAGDGPQMLRGAMVDVSSLKRVEMALAEARDRAERALAVAEAASLAKSRFMAAASHDLRQPLHALQMFLEVIAGLLPDPSHPAMVQAKRCVDGLSNQFRALLDLSKLDVGRLQIAPTRFDLGELIDQIVATIRPLADRKRLKIKVVRSSRSLVTDRNLFERLLTNLVSNALRYTERGGVVIGCRRRDGKDWIEVWDSGVGIPADSLSAIFEEFVQLNNPGRNSAAGTGLGLAIVDHIALALGLKVEVRSVVGKGSVFAVELPAGPMAVSEPIAGVAASAEPSAPTQSEDSLYR